MRIQAGLSSQPSFSAGFRFYALARAVTDRLAEVSATSAGPTVSID